MWTRCRPFYAEEVVENNDNMNKLKLLTDNLSIQFKMRILNRVLWNTVLYASETRSMTQPNRKRLKAMELWIWRTMGKKCRMDNIVLDTVRKYKHACVAHVLRHDSLLRDINAVTLRGKATRCRKRMHLLSDLMKGKYVALKRTAEDMTEWQNLLRPGSYTLLFSSLLE